MFLSGEWVSSNLLFGLAFLVAGLGCFGLGFWVIRGDRRNRKIIDELAETNLVATQHSSAPEQGLEESGTAAQSG